MYIKLRVNIQISYDDFLQMSNFQEKMCLLFKRISHFPVNKMHYVYQIT
jgi:hypothetical protein